MISQKDLVAYILFIFSFLSFTNAEAQIERKEYQINRIQSPPKIDGKFEDACWQNMPIATDFIQYDPENGPAQAYIERTEVKIAYDNNAIYVAAKMYDPNPENVLREIGRRDERGRNTDWLSFRLFPYNDGQNIFIFETTAAGVQLDARNWDFSWNAVWESEVHFTEDGWNLELKIPYAALRFPDTDIQNWGLNIVRSIRSKRSSYTWNFIDRMVGNDDIQYGLLTNIKDIKSPVRLSVMPYISSYLEHYEGETEYRFNGGLDIKYGLNESFTLDMTLVPDFGQAAFDNKILNISPFEVRFNENRTFFTEGTELFNKGGLFYSRRIGNAPTRKSAVEDDEFNDEDERNYTIIDNPTTTKLLNASKISGRNNKGLGIGFFNAVTDRTYATVRDSITNEKREILTESYANYNVLVLDQIIANNSFVTLVNTNVTREGSYRDANVTGLLFQLANKENSYSVAGSFKNSLVYDDELTQGFASNLNLNKLNGKFRFTLNQNIESDTYEINDLGFLSNNNEFTHWFEVTNVQFQPKNNRLSGRLSLRLNHSMIYKPRLYSDFNFSINGSKTNPNFLSSGFGVTIRPGNKYNYFEARTGDFESPFVTGPSQYVNMWWSSDYRRPFALDWSFNAYNRSDHGHQAATIRVSPRFRINNHLSFVLSARQKSDRNHVGYTTVDETNDDIIFAKRKLNTLTNEIQGSYAFTNRAVLSLNFRHYWFRLENTSFHRLDNEGFLQNTDYTGLDDDGMQKHDINYNSWNLDLSYTWQFAPGSEMIFLWRNAIENSSDTPVNGYFSNLETTFDAPILNSFSLRVLYFLDYLSLKKHDKSS